MREPPDVVGVGTKIVSDRTVVQRFVDLDHPNPYVAYIKSVAWAVIAATVVCAAEIVTASIFKLVFGYLLILFYGNNDIATFLVYCANIATLSISLTGLILVMVVETVVLLRRVSRGRET